MFPLFAANRIAGWILGAAYVIWLLPEIVSSYVIKMPAAAKRNDRYSGTFLIACIWLGIFAGQWMAFRERQFAEAWDPAVIFAFGIILMLAGEAFRWYSVRVLGRYFTRQVAIQPGQTVVEDGPYRWIRHPSYTGAMLTMFGAGLALTNWLSLFSIMVFAIVGYSYRIWVEEMTLVDALGEPYRDYMRRTKRIIPFII